MHCLACGHGLYARRRKSTRKYQWLVPGFDPLFYGFMLVRVGCSEFGACSKQPCMKHTQAMPFCMLQAQAQLPTRQGSRASQAEAGKSRQSSTCDALQAACSAEVKKERRIGNLRRVQGRRDGKQGFLCPKPSSCTVLLLPQLEGKLAVQAQTMPTAEDVREDLRFWWVGDSGPEVQAREVSNCQVCSV